ncbi:hypothetical protein J2736_003091 [Paenibacillus qinlingensis]|uniref:Uncharacterized protein n=1 Tax=Paenibacillus qinlingensis TaxID=1837343 RepID=A0ABU1NYJ6_9BACL|nr:hypothetical protein [Paenibacillus qinlingensis]
MSTTLSSNTTNHLSSDEAIHDRISPFLDKNELVLRTTFDNCYDIAFRRVQIFGQ